MLTKGFIFLIVAVVVVAVVAGYEYEHHHDHPPSPSPTVPAKYGMAGHPGKRIAPTTASQWVYSGTVPTSECNAQLRGFLESGRAIGGANFGSGPGPTDCHIFGPLDPGTYSMRDDPQVTAYLGHGHLQHATATPYLAHGQNLEHMGY